MNKLAIITAFLGTVKNRYMTYREERPLSEKLAIAAQVQGCDGVELCYPADFDDPAALKGLLERHRLGVSAINFRSRRTGKWWRGSFTSLDARERQEVADDLRRAMDFAADLGCQRVTTCPLNEGVDNPFEADFDRLYDHAAESLSAACAHNREVQVCLEYKKNDPRARSIFGSAGETAAFCLMSGAPNLGATLDIGHALQAQENPAQSAALLHRAGRLFYVHLNDNDGFWDWDMLPGAYHLWEFVELFYSLRKLGYDEDWYAFDVFSKEIDALETFNAVMHLTRKLEAITDRIDPGKMEVLLSERNPAKTVPYLYSLL
ncbi:MAG: sugar phosphate isomerase/epimerase [Anaerolineales bacterium]|nr:sugar phosphate isomerase/epimerase [Anaerolineales bacterium]